MQESSQQLQVVGVIPARLQSTRLPRKLLLDETGKTLLQHTWEAASRASRLSRLLIATDSDEIVRVAEGFGAQCQLTGEHPSGTDRLAEVTRRCATGADVLVNIQGDEPEVDPDSIDRLVGVMSEHPGADMATLATPIRDGRLLSDPSCTKVVCDPSGRALYFSRSCIPYCRDQDVNQLLETDSPWLLHIGIYAYRRDFLLRLTELPPSRLESIEKLEQLRALEIGAHIQVQTIEQPAPGIDTPEDYAQFVQRQTRQ